MTHVTVNERLLLSSLLISEAHLAEELEYEHILPFLVVIKCSLLLLSAVHRNTAGASCV